MVVPAIVGAMQSPDSVGCCFDGAGKVFIANRKAPEMNFSGTFLFFLSALLIVADWG
jgi:hypothetical protein